MEITVATNNWSDTKKMEALLSSVLKELGARADIGFVMGERTKEACMASLPAMIVDGKVLFEKRIPEEGELREEIRRLISSS